MPLNIFYIFCRWLHFASLMTLVGGSVYTVLLAPPRFRQHLSARFSVLLKTSALVALLTAVLLLVAQTGLMGGGWTDILDLSIWQPISQTRFGQVWQWQLFAALFGVVALLAKGRLRQQLLLVSGIGQLTGLALIGHAAILEGIAGWLQKSNQIVHLLSAAFWAGGLVPVLKLMRDARQLPLRYDAIHTLMCFSRYGHLAVALVVLSGAINALILLPWPPDFQRYSQFLLLKTLLVVVMCFAALFNRYWLIPRFQRCVKSAQYQFMLTTLAEVMLSVLVLLLVSLFATLEPA